MNISFDRENTRTVNNVGLTSTIHCADEGYRWPIKNAINSEVSLAKIMILVSGTILLLMTGTDGNVYRRKSVGPKSFWFIFSWLACSCMLAKGRMQMLPGKFQQQCSK